jgi:hypothetical protein
MRPDGTAESIVLSGRVNLADIFQPLRSWLISGVAPRQFNSHQSVKFVSVPFPNRFEKFLASQARQRIAVAAVCDRPVFANTRHRRSQSGRYRNAAGRAALPRSPNQSRQSGGAAAPPYLVFVPKRQPEISQTHRVWVLAHGHHPS